MRVYKIEYPANFLIFFRKCCLGVVLLCVVLWGVLCFVFILHRHIIHSEGRYITYIHTHLHGAVKYVV